MCHQIGLIDTINENIPCNTDIDPGTLVLGMLCDVLSGRSPLYKVDKFTKKQDTSLLLAPSVLARAPVPMSDEVYWERLQAFTSDIHRLCWALED